MKKQKLSILKKYDTAINKLNLRGRDEFYTHLIIQEHPFWFNQIANGKLIEQSEIDWFIGRRGFNNEEIEKIKSMAIFMNENSKLIIQINKMKQKSEGKPTTKRDLRDKSLSERLPENIFTRIHYDVGQNHARKDLEVIAFNLCHFIADELDKVKDGIEVRKNK